MRNAVISESTARRLYGSVDAAVGKPIRFNFIEYMVIGVVADVHKLSESSYSDIWLPYTVNKNYIDQNIGRDLEGCTGAYRCYILAREKKDFGRIRQEVASALARYNSASGKVEMSFLPPQTYIDRMFESVGEETREVFLKYILVILILLLVPGINLSGIAYSELRKRLPEIGIRKAFGATRRQVMWRMLRENLFLSLAWGVLGLLLSYLSIFLLSDWLLASNFGEPSLMTLSMFSPWIFGIAFLFCLLINLLSAGMPAWRAAGAEITTALNNEEL